MSGVANSPARVDYAPYDATSTLTDAASLAPLPASEAVGRAVGIDRASLVSPRPRREVLGAAGLMMAVAVASLPLMTVIVTQLL
ncbi:hypothetical protein [Microbacterium sp. 1.5R]|uniref:hypothetical protein n=1 Tax=Microbacterium sp. 1.5R TaxID=1916917 RepID=UPI0011A3F384|nr:hypothetical protein [Microbacterium sp. 1.5R]